MAPFRAFHPSPAAGTHPPRRVTDRIYTGPLPIHRDPRQEAHAAGPAPLFLLADSQPLFWSEGGAAFIDRIVGHTGPDAPAAAYVGASNGDNPDFYSIFLAAMDRLGPSECRMVPSDPTAEEMAFLARADVVLLSGGDVERGWEAFARNGMRGLGIPRAGALVVHPDLTVEAVRHPAFEVRMEEDGEVRAMILPPAAAER